MVFSFGKGLGRKLFLKGEEPRLGKPLRSGAAQALYAAATNKDDKYIRAKLIDYAFELSLVDTIKELIELKLH